MPAQPSYLKVTREPECTRVEFTEKHIIDEVVIRAIGNDLTKLVDDTHRPRLVICFKGVEHLSSAALGTLITVNNRVRSKEGQLRLADIDTQIYEVFVITKLNKIFKIHETAEKALASFA